MYTTARMLNQTGIYNELGNGRANGSAALLRYIIAPGLEVGSSRSNERVSGHPRM